MSWDGGVLRLGAGTHGVVQSIIHYFNAVSVESFTNSVSVESFTHTVSVEGFTDAVSVECFTSGQDPLLGGGPGKQPTSPTSGPCRIASINVAALTRARATAIFKHKEIQQVDIMAWQEIKNWELRP
eukprot:5204164-Pyramimonas_sp.AAC.1